MVVDDTTVTEPDELDLVASDAAGGDPGDDDTGPAWRSPVAWVGVVVLFLVASGGPVAWARVELADVTVPLRSDIWMHGVLVVSAGLVLAFSGDAWKLLRLDRLALGSTGALLAVLLLTAAWSLDGTRTVQQWILFAFATAAALFGGAWLDRAQVLTALFVALHVGIAISAFADLRDWPIAGGDDLAGVFGSTDAMGAIALLAAAATVMLMVAVLRRTPEERLARAEEKAARGGRGGFRMPSMRNINTARRYATAAQQGRMPPGGGGGAKMSPRTPGQAMQMRTAYRGRRRRLGALGAVRQSDVARIGITVLLVGVLVLDALLWWRSQSYGALFAVAAAAIVMTIVGLSMPGAGESGRRSAAVVLSVVTVGGVVALLVFRERVAEWFDRDATWSGRTTIWDAALEAARDRPLHGFGFEAGTGAAGFDVRSGFLQVLLGAGLLGLVAVVWLMLLALRRATSAALTRPDAFGVWVVGMAAYGIAANVNESLVSAWSLPWLLLVFALGHAIARLEERYDEPLV